MMSWGSRYGTKTSSPLIPIPDSDELVSFCSSVGMGTGSGFNRSPLRREEQDTMTTRKSVCADKLVLRECSYLVGVDRVPTEQVEIVPPALQVKAVEPQPHRRHWSTHGSKNVHI